jgi:uncharacterized protein with PQ loop repeat
MDTLELFGWLGNLLFAISAFPEVYKVLHNKKSTELTYGFLLMWILAILFSSIYLIGTDIQTEKHHTPIYFSYITSFGFAMYLLFSKIRYK